MTTHNDASAGTSGERFDPTPKCAHDWVRMPDMAYLSVCCKCGQRGTGPVTPPDTVHMVDGTPIAEGFLREGLTAREEQRKLLVFAAKHGAQIDADLALAFFDRALAAEVALARRNATPPDASGDVTEEELAEIAYDAMRDSRGQPPEGLCIGHAYKAAVAVRAALAARGAK